MPRSLNTRDTKDPDIEAGDLARKPRSAVRARAEQLLRFRRQQLQPAVRARRRDRGLHRSRRPRRAGTAILERRLARAARETRSASTRRCRRTCPRYCRSTSAGAPRPRSSSPFRPPKMRCRRARALPAASLATVFASSDADLAIIHRICLALTATPRLHLADGLPQLRAQRRRGLLEHRRGRTHGFDDDQRLRRFLRRRTARGLSTSARRAARRAAGGLRSCPRPSRCMPSVPSRTRPPWRWC